MKNQMVRTKLLNETSRSYDARVAEIVLEQRNAFERRAAFLKGQQVAGRIGAVRETQEPNDVQ